MVFPLAFSVCYAFATVFDLAEWQFMAHFFVRWIVCDDSAFEKIIRGVAIPRNVAGMAGVKVIGNGQVNPCHPQSATPS